MAGDPTYFSKLNDTQKRNISLISDRMERKGLTNPLMQGSILSVVSKESNFIPHREGGYSHTDNARIREVFKKLRDMPEAQLNALKANDKTFFDYVYDGIAGNGPGDGYRFRGGAFNQITGRANYRNIGKLIGMDLEANPDLLNDPVIAADALVAYFLDEFKRVPVILQQYHARNPNDFTNELDSLGAAYIANAGRSHLDPDHTGGYEKALGRIDGFVELIKKKHPEALSLSASSYSCLH